MKSRLLFLAPVALAAALAIPMSAQTSGQAEQAAPPVKAGKAVATKKSATPGINQRQRNQQARIRQGVKSGELTKHETRKLEREQGRIRADKLEAKSDGKVTKGERKAIHREQNKASKDIYKEKHDAQKRPPKKTE